MARSTRYTKSAATETSILDATVKCLASQGFYATNIKAVSQHAGVTRGCVLYYHKTVNDLFLATQEHIIDKLWGSLLAEARTIPQGKGRLSRCIDLVMQLPDSNYFLAWNELLSSARTRPELSGVVHRGAELLEIIHHELFREFHPHAPKRDIARFRAMDDLVVMFLHAVPLVQFLGDDRERKQRCAALLKELALTLLTPRLK